LGPFPLLGIVWWQLWIPNDSEPGVHLPSRCASPDILTGKPKVAQKGPT
jgi:hypothetical protein